MNVVFECLELSEKPETAVQGFLSLTHSPL